MRGERGRISGGLGHTRGEVFERWEGVCLIAFVRLEQTSTEEEGLGKVETCKRSREKRGNETESLAKNLKGRMANWLPGNEISRFSGQRLQELRKNGSTPFPGHCQVRTNQEGLICHEGKGGKKGKDVG